MRHTSRRSVQYALLALALLAATAGVTLLRSDAQPDPAPAATLRHALGPDPLDLGSLPPTPSPSPSPTATATPDLPPLFGVVRGPQADSSPPTPTPTPGAMASLSGPAAVPTPPPPTDHLLIGSIRLDARVTTAGLTPNLVMETPSDPFAVAWYTFTPPPGAGGNAVFSGHVDHQTAGRSIFWNLRKVKVGDIVEYRTVAGQSFRYRVVTILTLPAWQPANDVIAPTTTEMVTLITCTGSFDRSSLAYDSRLVVQAVREYQ